MSSRSHAVQPTTLCSGEVIRVHCADGIRPNCLSSVAMSQPSQKYSGQGGEPKLRQLEPDRRMAEIAPAPEGRRMKT
jgi:hypothetical protein